MVQDLNKQMDESIKFELSKAIEFITSLNGVLQVYLFGSYAYGEPGGRSDVDLMVLVSDDLDPIKTAFKINMSLVESEINFDVIVNRKSAFEEVSKEPSFQNIIKNNGVVLYADAQ